MNGTKKSTGPILVPGVWLSNIAVGLRLSGVEWRILSLVLAAPRPLATWRIAKYLKLEYTHAKRAVRVLMAWNILERSPRGLSFQPDYNRWGSSPK